MNKGLICPSDCGGEAVWAGEDIDVVAAPHLISLVNHFKRTQGLRRPMPDLSESAEPLPHLRDLRGQESAKRVFEIAEAGGHNLLMVGPRGSGKSMLS